MQYNLIFFAAGGASLNPLAFDPGAVVLTLITFVLTLILLSKMCWKPILKAAKDREDRIATNIDAANKAREEAEAMAAQYKTQLDEAKAEVARLLEDGRREANELKKDIVGKAHSEAEAARDRAGREIDLARDKAVAEIRAEAVDLSISVASRVLERSLDDDDHRKLAVDMLERIG
jgi:F-type H+-transporting ATPase subunit b